MHDLDDPAGVLGVCAYRRPKVILGVAGGAALVLLLVVVSTSGGPWLLGESALGGAVLALTVAAFIYQRRKPIAG